MSNILVITPYFYPHSGGSQEYIVGLYTAIMSKHPEVKVDILCYNTDGAKDIESYLGLNIHRIPCLEILPGQFALPNPFLLIKKLIELKKNNYVLVNAHTRFFDNSWWTPLVASYFGSKSLLTDHCASHPQHQNTIVRFLAALTDNIFAKTIAHNYSKIHTVSRATAEFMKKLGAPPSEIVHGGVDIKSIQKTKKINQVPKTKQVIAKDDIVISFVGRMIPAKGSQLLFDLAPDLISANPQVRVVFAGNGPLEKRKNDFSNDRIHFTGKLSRDEVYGLLKRTNIFVHPSTHHEGFPIVLLEAAAAKCAIIASHAGGTEELIEDGKSGIIINPDKNSLQTAIVKLLKNDKLREKYSQNTFEVVTQSFDWTKLSEHFYSKFIKNI